MGTSIHPFLDFEINNILKVFQYFLKKAGFEVQPLANPTSTKPC